LEECVRVRILDQEYLVKSEEDDDRVHEIAEFVNEKLLEIKNNTQGLSDKMTAILAAFHIASDYFQLLKERDEQEKAIQKRAQHLIYEIESALN
jgi:cell division protein ZapA